MRFMTPGAYLIEIMTALIFVFLFFSGNTFSYHILTVILRQLRRLALTGVVNHV